MFKRLSILCLLLCVSFSLCGCLIPNKKARDINTEETEKDPVEQKFDNIESSIVTIKKNAESTNNKIDSVDNKVKELSNQIKKLEDKIKDLENKAIETVKETVEEETSKVVEEAEFEMQAKKELSSLLKEDEEYNKNKLEDIFLSSTSAEILLGEKETTSYDVVDYDLLENNKIYKYVCIENKSNRLKFEVITIEE